MIALDLWFIKIYRYGIFYAMSFVFGYFLIKYITKYMYQNHSATPKIANLYRQIYKDIDDIIVYIAMWVIVWGRLGEVLIYNISYYIANPIKILYLQDGGMSFVGGFLWVMIAIFYYKYIKKLSFDQILVVFDLIVLILPIGIVLGRLGNFLNQELIGQTINNIYQKYNLTSTPGEMLAIAQNCLNSGFCHIYDRVDSQIRLNSNLLEWLLEWILTWVIGIWIWLKSYQNHPRPGYITGIFMIIYSICRYILENFRDNPSSEYIYGLLKSQLWMIWFCLFGIWLVSRKKYL